MRSLSLSLLKSVRVFLSVLLLALGLAACGGDPGAADTEEEAAALSAPGADADDAAPAGHGQSTGKRQHDVLPASLASCKATCDRRYEWCLANSGDSCQCGNARSYCYRSCGVYPVPAIKRCF